MPRDDPDAIEQVFGLVLLLSAVAGVALVMVVGGFLMRAWWS